MTTLTDLIGDRAVQREDWLLLAREWNLHSDYTLQEIAPAGVTCTTCWDHGLCAECLGEYPDRCPADCGDGRCPACGRKAIPIPIRTRRRLTCDE